MAEQPTTRRATETANQLVLLSAVLTCMNDFKITGHRNGVDREQLHNVCASVELEDMLTAAVGNLASYAVQIGVAGVLLAVITPQRPPVDLIGISRVSRFWLIRRY